MTIAIMQPYFFPYLGYFQLIRATERFILFDDVQYIRHGWINRNRVLKPADGEQYITMPLASHDRGALIKDITATNDDWKEKILRQLEHYKKRAPYYPQVHQLLTNCFSHSETNITLLNGHYLQQVCNYIGIPFTIEVSSSMAFDYSHVHDAGEWALRISEQLGASTYINPPGGVALFDNSKFVHSNIELYFIHPQLSVYDQRRPLFTPGLSIIDILMFNTPQEVIAMLQQYEIKKAT